MTDIRVVSTGIRFTTIPDASPPSQQLHDIQHTSQPPTTVTAVLNPILGHISAAYASRVSRDLALCSRFDFNVYSYESEWTMGAEWWIRRPLPGTSTATVDDSQGLYSQEPQGVLKARISTNYVRVNPLSLQSPLTLHLGRVHVLGGATRTCSSWPRDCI